MLLLSPAPLVGLGVLLASFHLFIMNARAEGISTVQCLPEYGWMNNSLGEVIVLLFVQLVACLAPCYSGPFIVTPLPPGYLYAGPDNATLTPCDCSSVVYSMLSACGICQGRGIQSWTDWSAYCQGQWHIPEGTYPVSIESGTRIPSWAYTNPLHTNSTFDRKQAKRIGDNVESSASAPQSTSTSSTRTPSSFAALPSGSTSGPPAPTPGNDLTRSQRVGIVVGTTIGAVVVAALIAGGIIFGIIRARRRRISPSSSYVNIPLETQGTGEVRGTLGTNDNAHAGLSNLQRGWIEWNEPDNVGREDTWNRGPSATRVNAFDYGRLGNSGVPRIREPVPPLRYQPHQMVHMRPNPYGNDTQRVEEHRGSKAMTTTGDLTLQYSGNIPGAHAMPYRPSAQTLNPHGSTSLFMQQLATASTERLRSQYSGAAEL